MWQPLTITRADTRQDAVVSVVSSQTNKLFITPSTVTIPAGQSSVTVSLVGVDNQIVDGTVPVNINVSSQNMIDAMTTIDVLDYEPLGLIIANDTFSERGGATIGQLTRSDPNGPLVVTLTATPENQLSVPVAILFADGESISQGFPITAIDNQLVDGTRVARVDATADGYISTSAEINLTDFEELDFVVDSTVIPENSGTVELRLRRTDARGSVLASLTSTSPARMTVPTTVSFNDGDNLSQPIIATVFDNDFVEGEIPVSIVASMFGYERGIVDLTISDHEQLIVTRTGGPLTETSGTVTYTVTRPAAGPDTPVTLAGGGVNSLRLPNQVRFDPGATEVSFDAEVIDNEISSGDQLVSISASATGYVTGTRSETIADNDTPEMALVLLSESLIEGHTPTLARIVRNTRGPLEVAITQSVDGTLSVPESVAFQPGRAFVEFPISVPDNDLADGSRIVDLTITAPGHPTDTQTVTVVDDEVASFGFTQTDLQVVEAGNFGVASIVLHRRPITAVTVSVSTSDVSQLTVTPTEITFTPDNWSLPQSVTVNTIDDQTSEGTKQYSLIATVTSGIAFSELGDETLPVTVVDDDVPMIELQETDGTTLVTEFGLNDHFSLSLGTKPLSSVQISIDGSQVAEALFEPSVLTFTPDNWDQPQVVTVSTPLDFDADLHQIGSVYINVDDAQSDPVYRDASRRIIGVVHIDSNLSDLRIRRENDRIVLIDVFTGATLRSTSVTSPQPALLQMGSRAERVFIESMDVGTQYNVSTRDGNDTISLEQMLGGSVDGGAGYDVVKLLADGTLPDELSGGFALRNIEQIDLTVGGTQHLVLSPAQVIAMTDANNRLDIELAEGDELSLDDGWLYSVPFTANGVAVHELAQAGATIRLTSQSEWQNPFGRFDVNRDGQVSPSDALAAINRLSVDGNTELPPITDPQNNRYYDVNGDHFVTPRDALAVINELTRRQSLAEPEQVQLGFLDEPAHAFSAAAVDAAILIAAQSDWLDDDEEDA